MSEKTQLAPAYAIIGSDQLKCDESIKRLVARLGDTADFNLDRRTITSADEPADLLNSLNQLPFAAPFRLVIIDNADHLPKEISESIVSYLKDPSPTTVLCLVAEKLAKGTRLYKAVAGAGSRTIIDCSPKKRRDLPPVVSRIAANHGKNITSDATAELLSRIGESTLMIDSQVASLAALIGQRDTITIEDVERFVARTEELKPWDLVDAICDRDVPKALQTLRLMDTVSPVLIHSFLTGRIRELICTRICIEQGNADGIATALGKPAWQTRNYSRWARNYSMAELEAGLVAARDCERVVKGSGDSYTALLLWISNFMS